LQLATQLKSMTQVTFPFELTVVIHHVAGLNLKVIGTAESIKQTVYKLGSIILAEPDDQLGVNEEFFCSRQPE